MHEYSSSICFMLTVVCFFFLELLLGQSILQCSYNYSSSICSRSSWPNLCACLFDGWLSYLRHWSSVDIKGVVPLFGIYNLLLAIAPWLIWWRCPSLRQLHSLSALLLYWSGGCCSSPQQLQLILGNCSTNDICVGSWVMLGWTWEGGYGNVG